MHGLVSIVIPAYNEVDRLPASLRKIRDYAQSSALDVEVIAVDDGSADGTVDMLREHAREWPALRVVALGHNRGKGAAVRAGIEASRGDAVAFTDADLAAPIEQLTVLLDDLRDADVAIVSRALPGARISRRQSRVRELFGKAYAALAQLLLIGGVPDAQCGLKVYRGDLARRVYARVGEAGILFDTEALLLCALAGARISQRPAVWSHDPNSRLRFNIRKALDVAAALMRIKTRHRVLLPVRVRGPIRSGAR